MPTCSCNGSCHLTGRCNGVSSGTFTDASHTFIWVSNVPVTTFTPDDIDKMLCFGGKPETLVPLVRSGQIKLGGGLTIDDLLSYRRTPTLTDLLSRLWRWLTT